MIGAAIRRLVRARANDACEYCLRLQEQSPLAALQVEHVVPRKHGGGDEFENLALACIDCNLAKGSNLAGVDPETHTTTELFNPRKQHWDEHFSWRGAVILGKTSTGRTTVEVLRMNSDEQIQLRFIRLKRAPA